MLKILSKRERVIVTLTITVLALSVVFNLFILPALNKSQALNREIRVVKSRLIRYKMLISQKDRIQAGFANYKKLPLSAERKENEDPLVIALSELEAIASDAGVRIIDLRPQIPLNSFRNKDIIIDLRSEASIKDYLKFIYNLETSIALLKIQKFQLNAKPNTSLLEGTFSINKLSLD
ncbi:MAG: hypothetical protein AB1481_06065 [Candidatus Omnitrophota bacterium]